MATSCTANQEPLPRSRSVITVVGEDDRGMLAGAGSTAVVPLLRQWFEQYRRVAPGVSIRYQLGGSPAGVDLVRKGQADFALSDLPVAGDGRSTARRGARLLQLPVVGLGVAVIYNLPGRPQLRLGPDTLAAILQGNITKWSDPAILADNPGADLPPLNITVVHRTEPSGTTGVLTRYLQQAASSSWRLGFHDRVAWPQGVPVQGSEAMVSAVKATRGAVGYVATGYSTQPDMGMAAIENDSDNYVAPAPEAVAATLHGAVGNDDDLTLEVPLTKAARGYPIAGFSYLVVRMDASDSVLLPDALRHFAEWMMSEGQREAERLGYSPVPLPLLVRTFSGLGSGGVPPRS